MRLRCGCPILYPLPGIVFFLKALNACFSVVKFFVFVPKVSSSNTEKNEFSAFPEIKSNVKNDPQDTGSPRCGRELGWPGKQTMHVMWLVNRVRRVSQ